MHFLSPIKTSLFTEKHISEQSFWVVLDPNKVINGDAFPSLKQYFKLFGVV